MTQEAKIFKYQTPEFEGVKKSMIVCHSDLMKVMVQVVKDGGENNLHTHTGDDAFWYVKVHPTIRWKSSASPRRTRPSKTSGSISPRPSSG
jgi:hypothetical protein